MSTGLVALLTLFAAEKEGTSASPRFTGASSCSSSSCHGGAGAHQNQFEIWSAKDAHSRAFATLTTARSLRIGETLGIKTPAVESRCTVCHAPFHDVPKARRAAAADALQGVSCESCHGAAEPWLRSHTRSDYTHAQRLAAGMRDLRSAAGRAAACVACHQVIDPELLRAGHPELIFELDGQSASQPRHWSRTNDAPGPVLWLAGQAAALREMSWQLLHVTNAETRQVHAWQGLAWLLGKFTEISMDPTAENLRSVHRIASQWLTKGIPEGAKEKLLATSPDFRDANIPTAVQARRAERLVLALDRLTGGTNQAIDELFQAVQSLPDFNPQEFSRLLEKQR